MVASEVAPVYDAVILTCKAYDLDAAVAAIAPAVAPNGYVLPFLNGIAHIDVLNEKFGQHRVLGGTAKIQATITPNGAIRQLNDWRTLAFGEQSGEMTERVRTLAAMFEAAKGVEVFAVADVVQRMWEKLVHLSTAAAMTCLMRANVGEIVRTPHGREIFLEQLRCGAAIAGANGHAPSAAFMKSWAETFSQRDSQYSTSMLRDIERGGQTEVEHILGFMLDKAVKSQIACNTLLLAYTSVKAYDEPACVRPFKRWCAPGTAGSQTISIFRPADSRHIRTGAHSSGHFVCPCRASGCFMSTWRALHNGHD